MEGPVSGLARPAAPQLVLLGFVLALVGQLFLSRGHSAVEGLILYGLAVVALVRGSRAWDLPLLNLAKPKADDASPAGEPSRRWARQARLALGFLVPLAFLGFGGNRITAGAMLSLLAAMAAYGYLFWRPSADWTLPKLGWRPGPDGLQIRVSWTSLALVAVLALGVAFRFGSLADLPSDMTSDHAEKYLDIQDIQQGARPIFFARNSGREGTEFYLASLLTGLTGYTYLTLKLVMCAASVAEIPFVYLFGRELAGRRVGLVAAFLIAISKWDLAVARFAIRASFASLYSAIALYLLYRGLLRREPKTFLLLGLVMGLGLYGYTSFRIVLLFVPFVVAAFLAFEPHLRGQRWTWIRQTLVAYGVTGLVALPLLRYGFDYPQQFLFRSATRITGVENPLVANPLGVFAGNLWNAALMFNWQGDRSWVTQVPSEPSLDWVTGALFVVGVASVLYRGWRQRDAASATLLSGLFVLTLPSTLAIAFPIENPHLSRANPVLPVVMVLAALGFEAAVRAGRAVSSSPAAWPVIVGVSATLGVAAVVVNYQSYFVDYVELHQRSTQNEKEIAAVIKGYAELEGSDRSAYLTAWPYWVDYRLVALELGDFAWRDHALVDPIEKAADQARQPGPKLYVLHHDDAHGLAFLQSLFPRGLVQEHVSTKPGRDFRTFFVPG